MARDNNVSDENENGERWKFFSNVFAVISLQLLLALALGSVVVSVSKIPHFVLHTAPGLAIYTVSIVFCLIIQCVLLHFTKSYPYNYILFTLWTILFASAIGLSCSYSKGRGKTVLEAAILMSVVAVGLTLHSMWSMTKDRKFRMGELLIIGIFLVACVYIPIQVFHPFAKLSTSIWGCLVALSFCVRVCLAANCFVEYKYCDPIGTAVIIHVFLLISNPNRKEVTGRGRR